MTNELHELIQQVAIDSIDPPSVREACPTCQRGAIGLATPSLDDLNAMLTIKEGFDRYRRNFTPEMEDRMSRFDKVIGYVHALIAGTPHA